MDLLGILQELQCRLGFHDFRVIEVTYGFGDAGDVEKVECRRCGTTMVREQSPRD
ncbi:MAG: hypothetical protein O3A85_07180 [Proteobacteria bacterium]|nr:hypothetical protein [Pseudomonadota bacterium]